MPRGKNNKKTENKTFHSEEIAETESNTKFPASQNQNHNTKKEALGPNTKRQG